jgi:predicted DNA binding CopG/RHH family protein
MRQSIPKTDSIEELAEFWQAHDLTDFEDELLEVEASPFRRRGEESLRVPLSPAERKAVRQIAASQGLEETALIQRWVREKLPHPQ